MMKNLQLIFFLFLILLIISYEENSVTAPILDRRIQKTRDSTIHCGTIALEGMLENPHLVKNSFYLIYGEIQYQHTLAVPDLNSPNLHYLVSLDLSVSANFTNLYTVCGPPFDNFSAGTISIETNNNILISEGSTYQLVKIFPIQGRDDGMILNCRIRVTTYGVQLNETWLE